MKDLPIQILFGVLDHLEACARTYENMQKKIAAHVDQGILTASEMAVLIEKTTQAFVDIDNKTIEVEKILEQKIRKITGLKNLTTSLIRWNTELDDMIAKRKKENPDQKPKGNLKIDY